MSTCFIITATGTGVGKTLTSAMLMLGLEADYWKPLQSGTPTDRDMVKELTGLPPDRFHPEAYAFSQPLSPHRAAELDNIVIDPSRLSPPVTQRPLIIEGAGGLMVPITRSLLMIDFFKNLHAPVILCARTELGTINHTLLSVEALRARAIPVHGIIFIGPAMDDTVKTIEQFSKTRVLGRIPLMQSITAPMLRETFETHFRKADFL